MMLAKRRVIVWQIWLEKLPANRRSAWRRFGSSLPLALTLACAWHFSRTLCGGAERGWRAALGWCVVQALRVVSLFMRSK